MLVRLRPETVYRQSSQQIWAIIGGNCDDNDAAVNPGAQETCGDGIDQDCDGQDETCPCLDADGDGFTDSLCGGDDCDDGDPAVNPNAQEICGDNLDQDCDGVDRVCDCADADADGYGQGPDCLGSDCNDLDPTCWEGACCEPSPCMELSGCALACDPNDQDCLFACFTDVEATDAVLIMELTICGATHECQDVDCLLTYCQELYQGCLSGCYDPDLDEYGWGSSCQTIDCDAASATCHQGTCCPEGLSCGDVANCFFNCPSYDPECPQNCWNSATAEAKIVLIDLFACIGESGCETALCIWQQCRAELTQCNN